MIDQHSYDLNRVLAIWPELNETMRSNILAIASLSLLKHGKVGPGLLTLGSSLRLRTSAFLRQTKAEVITLSQYAGDLIRREEETPA